MNNDLKIIKKKYGEKMMHFLRNNYSTLLEKDGLLSELMLNTFEPSHELYDDIINYNLEEKFKRYLFSLCDIYYNKNETSSKNPKEIFDSIGYYFYVCHTEDDIQMFKKYYAPNEELCTFKGGRLDNFYVFFAVRKDIENIKRINFPNPYRQDEYGTSIISIQFSKNNNHLSIKNRYNHTVDNPDATYSNYLDNICPGLSYAFKMKYGLESKRYFYKFDIPNYILDNNNKYYKYNREKNGIYYCSNNIIIDNSNVIRYDKEKYLFMDYFIVDLVKKNIFLYDDKLNDCFCEIYKNINSVRIINDMDSKYVLINYSNNFDLTITLNKDNQIVSLEDNNIEIIGDCFLRYNTELKNIGLSKVRNIGDCFLANNNCLKSINLPNLIKIGSNFICTNTIIEDVSLPKVQELEGSFLRFAKILQKISLPSVEKVGRDFLSNCSMIQDIYLPNLKYIDDYFLAYNDCLTKLDLPNVKFINNCFLIQNIKLKELILPEVEEIGYGFLVSNKNIDNIYMPKIKKIETNNYKKLLKQK